MLKRLILSTTALDSYKIFAGNFISSVCGFLIITLLTRAVKVEELGIFLTALTFTQLVSDLFELGINPASINFIAQGKKAFLQASFFLKIASSIFVAILLFLLAFPISTLIFKNVAIVPYIQASALGVGFLGILNWGQAIFQAEKNFTWASIVSGSGNIFRLVAIILLLTLGINNAAQNYFIFHLALIFSVIIFFWKFGFKKLRIKSPKENYMQILKFGLPIGLGFGVAAIYTRLDQIFVFSLAGEKEAAVYGLASRLIIILIFVITAFNSAIVIRFVSLESEKFIQYFRKTYLAIIALSGLLVISMFIAPFFIPLLFGQKFGGAVIAYQILTIGIIFFCFALPIYDVILYRYKQPFFSFWISVISLILVCLFLQYLIPKYGSIGAAAGMTSVYLIQLILSIGYYFKIKNA